MDRLVTDPMLGREFGPYRVERTLGRGGMGVVYEALHGTIGKRAAIKVLHPEFSRNEDTLQRFFNEARAVGKLQNQGLVQVFDYGKLPDGTAYIMMEYLPGESLGARLEQGQDQRLPLEVTLQLARQLAAALHAVHAVGIVHRDLKPDNVFLVPDSATLGNLRAKVLDFGIAKFLTDSPGQETTVGMILGTPRYMSPEQCDGRGQLTDRVDVYALGVMLFEMLAGRPPFLAETGSALMRQHMFKDPPSLLSLAPWVPFSLHVLVQEMLSKEPQQRPSMEQVAQRLAKVEPDRLPWLKPLRPYTARASVAAALLIATLGGVRLWRSAAPPRQPTPLPAAAPEPPQAPPRTAAPPLKAPPTAPAPTARVPVSPPKASGVLKRQSPKALAARPSASSPPQALVPPTAPPQERIEPPKPEPPPPAALKPEPKKPAERKGPAEVTEKDIDFVR